MGKQGKAGPGGVEAGKEHKYRLACTVIALVSSGVGISIGSVKRSDFGTGEGTDFGSGIDSGIGSGVGIWQYIFCSNLASALALALALAQAYS